VAQYGSTDSGASLGDILGAALGKDEEEEEEEEKVVLIPAAGKKKPIKMLPRAGHRLALLLDHELHTSQGMGNEVTDHLGEWKHDPVGTGKKTCTSQPASAFSGTLNSSLIPFSKKSPTPWPGVTGQSFGVLEPSAHVCGLPVKAATHARAKA
jgi:hypothetical protein